MTAIAEAPSVKRTRDAKRRGRMSAPRIGVLYPSGWGNLGDEAILQAMFAALHKEWPDAAVRAFTLHPTRTAANHRVETDYLTGVNRPMFLSPRADGPFPVRAARAVARRTRRVPLLGKMSDAVANLTAAMIYEMTALKRAWSWLRAADLVLVAGGGQLDAAWGGTWGQPYALARWAWIARRARVPFAFLSVGFGRAPSWLSRRMIRYAVENSVYCSVRDVGSRTLTLRLGVKRDLPVVPDLAFALHAGSPLPARRPGYEIGISPMVFLRPGGWPEEDGPQYQRLVALWADLVAARVARGDRVHLFVSDPGDMDAVRDVWARLSESVRANSSISQAASPDALLDFYRGLDLVVSSRLHGVLLAIVAGRPVLALAHERKVRAVMSDAGMANFCTDLTTVSQDQIEASVRELTSGLDDCAEQLRQYVVRARYAVRRQEELLPQFLKRAT